MNQLRVGQGFAKRGLATARLGLAVGQLTVGGAVMIISQATGLLFVARVSVNREPRSKFWSQDVGVTPLGAECPVQVVVLTSID